MLMTSRGVELKEPVAFDTLYHAYADSWRVEPQRSLFSEPSPIKPGIPERAYFAKDLEPQVAARAEATCTAAGVTNPELLDDCMLDTAVLDDEKAAQVFAHLPVVPRYVVKPVSTGKP
jgi:hypothetical protein